METFIKVRWGFFALPALLVCLTLALLVGVIFDHRKYREVGVLKSSVLASMANGIDDGTKSSFVATNNLSAMSRQASGLKVGLVVAQDRTYLHLESN